MPKYYTTLGDDGTTGLLGEGRVKKYDLRMEALGTLDELSAVLGFARSLSPAEYSLLIRSLQNQIYEFMAEVAATQENQSRLHRINSRSVCNLEETIKTLSAEINNPEGFILSGDSQVSAAVSIARTITRRAERRIAELIDNGTLSNPELLRFLNRLSSLLFVLEIKMIESLEGTEPTLARKTSSW
jgi:cob(I)alamin adenosyltransferase